MGRPRKNPGTRVVDQMHIGIRFEDELAKKMFVVVAAANERAAKAGLPPKVSISSLAKMWLLERLEKEVKKLSET